MYKYTTRLKLKSKRKNYGRLHIEIDFNINGTRIRRYINLNEKIHSSDLVKGTLKTKYKPNLEGKVETRMLQVKELLRDIEKKHGHVTPELYDSENEKSKNTSSTNPTLLSLIDEFMTKKKITLDSRTIQKYKTLETKIKKYTEDNKLNSPIYLHAVNKLFLEKLQQYYVGQELSNSTINKYESCLNTVLDFGKKELNFEFPNDYTVFKKINKEDADKVILLKEEIEKINNLKDLTEAEERIKDCFIFQILTGLRFSDLERVKKAWITGSSLKFTSFKTTIQCQVPLHPRAIEILEKYDNNLKKIVVSNQYYNRMIKLICKKAKITQESEKLSKVFNRRKFEVKPKCDLISSHTARSTFITHCIMAGITPFVIMKYVGHKKITTMQTYVRIAEAITEESFDKFTHYLPL